MHGFKPILILERLKDLFRFKKRDKGMIITKVCQLSTSDYPSSDLSKNLVFRVFRKLEITSSSLCSTSNHLLQSFLRYSLIISFIIGDKTILNLPLNINW